MNLLLPHQFKKIGIVLIPLGFIFWLLMQRGVITQLLVFLLGGGDYHVLNVVVASISFFGFLGGFYCIAFAKEKIEDEMIQSIRVNSFQMAALIQLLFTICGFISWLLLASENEREVVLLLLVASLLVFWFGFIARFHYMLYVKLK